MEALPESGTELAHTKSLCESLLIETLHRMGIEYDEGVHYEINRSRFGSFLYVPSFGILVFIHGDKNHVDCVYNQSWRAFDFNE